MCPWKPTPCTRRQSGSLAGNCQYCHVGYSSFPLGGRQWNSFVIRFCLVSAGLRGLADLFHFKMAREKSHYHIPPSTFFIVTLVKVNRSLAQIAKWGKDSPFSLFICSLNWGAHQKDLECMTSASDWHTHLMQSIWWRLKFPTDDADVTVWDSWEPLSCGSSF